MNKIRRSSVLLLSMGLLLSLSVGASASPVVKPAPASSLTITPTKAPGHSNIQVSTQDSAVEFVLPANADDLNKEAVSSIKSSSQPVATAVKDDIISASSNAVKTDGDITIYGTSAPTSYYNIAANGTYTGSFWTNNNVIYTNSYFSPNSDKKLFLNIQTSKEASQTTTFKYVYLFSNDQSGYLTRTAVDVPVGTTITFSNLDTNKFYYIGFGVDALNKGYEGDIRVYH